MTDAGKKTDEHRIATELLTVREQQVFAAVPGILSVHTRNGELVWGAGDFMPEKGGAGKTDHMKFLEVVNPQDRPALLEAIDKCCADPTRVRIGINKSKDDTKSDICVIDVTCASYTPEKIVLPETLVVLSAVDVSGHVEELSLAEQRVNEAEKRLADTNELFAAVSHELRTPLNAISGFSELLEGKAAIRLNEYKKLEYAGLINQSAAHLLKLINGMLDLTRLEAGCRHVNRSNVDLVDVVSTSCKMLMPLAVRKSVNIVLEADEFLPNVFSDEQMLTQIFINLLSNAVKFSQAECRVDVGIQRRRNCLEVHVRDYGVGMSRETLAGLGTAFFQGGATISRDYGGTGLGLAVAYQQVELLEGTITAESEPGSGATFSVCIPLNGQKATPVSAEPGAEIVYLKPEPNPEPGRTMKLNSGAEQ